MKKSNAIRGFWRLSQPAAKPQSNINLGWNGAE
jgi:hypothetical protein